VSLYDGSIDKNEGFFTFLRERFENDAPYTPLAPSVVAIVDRRARSISLREIAPRCSRSEDIEDTIEDLAIIFALRTTSLRGKKRLNNRPLQTTAQNQRIELGPHPSIFDHLKPKRCTA